MKSKYFNISENQDGTYTVKTRKGIIIDGTAQGYEINPKQPKFIKIRHDGGAWCSLFNEHGCALKDTMWVNDVVMNDDGSYRVQEYIHDKSWRHYNNGATAKRLWHKYVRYVSGVAVSGVLLTVNFSAKSKETYQISNQNGVKCENNSVQKVSSAKGKVLPLQKERIRE